MDKKLKRIFRWIFPVARVEVSVFISVVAVYLFTSIEGSTYNFLKKEWIKGDHFFVIILCFVFFVAAVLLLLPFIEIIRWEQFDEIAAKLSVFKSTFVFACCYGWLMAIYLRKYADSEKWMGLNSFLLLAIISGLGLSLLIFALFNILDLKSEELPEFNPDGSINAMLLLVNLFLTTVLITSNYFLKWLDKPDVALILFNVYFLASKLAGYKSADTMTTGEEMVSPCTKEP